MPSPTPAAPEAGHKLEYWSPALGSWAADGERGASLRFVTLGADETGAAVGTHTVTAKVTVAADGRSWQGSFRFVIEDAAGTGTGEVAGTVKATRIAAGGPA